MHPTARQCHCEFGYFNYNGRIGSWPSRAVHLITWNRHFWRNYSAKYMCQVSFFLLFFIQLEK